MIVRGFRGVGRMGVMLAALLALLAGACGDSGDGSGTGGTNGPSGSGTSGGNGGSSGSGGGGSSGSSGDTGTVTTGSCDTDPLHTGLTAQQTGVSVDAFDCAILKWTAHFNEPDPMIFKAIIYVESRFDRLAVACPNLPCGVPDGWVDAESHCFGLMQIVPACKGDANQIAILPDGHPDLSNNTSASDFAGSVFNPDVNIQIGIAGVADNRAQVMKQFAGCTVEQYTLMAIGNYNSYGSAKSCTEYNSDYDNGVLDAYHQYATAAGYPAHAY